MSDEVCLYEAFAEDGDSIEDVLNKEYAKGYEKGRADKEKELQGLKDLGKLYSEIRADAIEEIYNELLYVESKFRSMWLNTTQESNLIEWVDLNGKLMAITTIKHMIQDKLKEQK